MHECNTCSVRTVSDSSRRTCLIFSKVILDCFRISELCVDLYLMDILSHDCITEFCSSKILRDFQLPPSRSRSPLAKEVPMARAQGHGNTPMLLGCGYLLPPALAWHHPWKIGTGSWRLRSSSLVLSLSGSLGTPGWCTSSTISAARSKDLAAGETEKVRTVASFPYEFWILCLKLQLRVIFITALMGTQQMCTKHMQWHQQDGGTGSRTDRAASSMGV